MYICIIWSQTHLTGMELLLTTFYIHKYIICGVLWHLFSLISWNMWKKCHLLVFFHIFCKYFISKNYFSFCWFRFNFYMILSIVKYYYFYWPASIRPIKDIFKINYKPQKKCVFHHLLNVIPIYTCINTGDNHIWIRNYFLSHVRNVLEPDQMGIMW